MVTTPYLASSQGKLQLLVVMCMPHVVQLSVPPLLILLLLILLGSLLGLLLFVVTRFFNELSGVFALRGAAEQHNGDHLLLAIGQRGSLGGQQLRAAAKCPCQLSLLLLDLSGNQSATLLQWVRVPYTLVLSQVMLWCCNRYSSHQKRQHVFLDALSKPTPRLVHQCVLTLQAYLRQDGSHLSNKWNVLALSQAPLGHVRRPLLSLCNSLFSSHELFNQKGTQKSSVKQDAFCAVSCLKSSGLSHILLYTLTSSLLTKPSPACNSAKTLQHSTQYKNPI